MQAGEVRVEAGELLGQLPNSEDEENNVDKNDEAHRAEEAPDEAVLQGQPAAVDREHAVTSAGRPSPWACAVFVRNSLLLCAVAQGSAARGHQDDEEGRPVTHGVHVERPHRGVEHQDDHSVQLHPFQQHPGEHGQKEEMQHRRHKPAAGLSGKTERKHRPL